MIKLLINKNLYYVGGVVRDKLIGAKSIDTDLCYEGDAINFANNSNFNIVKINQNFGTVRIVSEEKEIDIASTRIETYPKKGHLPKILKIGCSLKDDLIRRDFTVNAMARRTTDNELIDYYNGYKDLEQKTLNVLHENSFIDDPTRIIRGLKFAIRFNFSLSEKTKLLQDKYLNNINYNMSYHRIKKELIETFNLNSPKAFDKFIKDGIYKLLGNDVKVPNIEGYNIKAAIKNHKNNIWFIYIAPFLVNQNNILLPLTRSEKRILEWVKRLQYQDKTNNTPIESIIIRGVLDNV